MVILFRASGVMMPMTYAFVLLLLLDTYPTSLQVYFCEVAAHVRLASLMAISKNASMNVIASYVHAAFYCS